MRTPDSHHDPLRRRLARLNRSVANPVVRLFAGRLPPFAVVRHRGRRSGRDFATPVLAFATADGLVVGVLYGTSSDWVRNVLAAGAVRVKRRGTVLQYQRPRLVGRDEGLRLVPALLRGPYRALGVQDMLRLTVSAYDEPPA